MTARDPRALRGHLVGAEQAIEDLARTVACPNCDAEPGRPCRGEAIAGRIPGRRNLYAAHTGRLLAAQEAAK